MAAIPSPVEIRSLFSLPGLFEAGTFRRAPHGIDVFGVLTAGGARCSIGVTVRQAAGGGDFAVVAGDLGLGWRPTGRKVPSEQDFQSAALSLLKHVGAALSDSAWIREVVGEPPPRVASWAFTLMARPRTITDDMLEATTGDEDLEIRVQLHSNCVQKCLFCPTCLPAYSERDQDGDLAFITEMATRIAAPAREHGLFPTFRIEADDLLAHRRLQAIMKVIFDTCGCPMDLVVPANRLASASVVQAVAGLPGLVGLTTTILGATAATHDLVAGRDGAFAETVRGIRNIGSTGLRVQGNFVLTSAACREIGQTVGILAHFGVDAMIQNLIADCAGHEKILGPILPTLDSVRQGLEISAGDILAAAELVNVGISDFPPCVVPLALRHLTREGHLRESLFGYTLAEPCQACVHRERCAGLSSAYRDLYGASGVRPEFPGR